MSGTPFTNMRLDLCGAKTLCTTQIVSPVLFLVLEKRLNDSQQGCNSLQGTQKVFRRPDDSQGEAVII